MRRDSETLQKDMREEQDKLKQLAAAVRSMSHLHLVQYAQKMMGPGNKLDEGVALVPEKTLQDLIMNQ